MNMESRYASYKIHTYHFLTTSVHVCGPQPPTLLPPPNDPLHQDICYVKVGL